MKIYTKTGDLGFTSLIGGVRVSKSSLRIECYGTIDELNSYIGLVASVNHDGNVQNVLAEIQDRLFTIGSHLASHPEKSRMKLPDLNEEDILLLENQMDLMNENLPELKSFILPGGSTEISFCHIARCICRRAERLCVHLNEDDQVENLVIKYLNRLSDYLFVLSRKMGHDKNVSEIPWRPRN